MICPECGAENSPNRNFCYVCAAPLTRAAAGQTPLPPSPPVPVRPAAPAPMSSPPAASARQPVYVSPAAQAAPRRSPGWLWLLLAGGVALLTVVAAWQFLASGGTGGAATAPTASAPKAVGPSTRATATPAPRLRPNDTLLVPRASRRPEIDGRLSGEWAGEGYPVPYVVFGKEKWNGSDDLSARLWFAWDDDNFYVASAVVDDVFSQPSRGEALYQGDSVEIQWDVDLEGDFDVDQFNADDWHIGLSPGNFKDVAPEAYVWTPKAQTGAAAGIRVAAQRVATGDGRQGYTIEAVIPWRTLGVEPRPNQVTGFTFSVSDNDAPGPAQETLLSTSARREWHRPSTFNNLILQP